MKLDELVMSEDTLDEGLTHFKLSDKITKLLKLVKDKSFHIPGEEKTKVEKVIDVLEEILIKVKKIERDFEKGNITRTQAVNQIRAFKIKAVEVKKYLQEKNVLSRTDWKFLISTGLSLIWIPLVFSKASTLLNLLFPQHNSMKTEEVEDEVIEVMALEDFVAHKDFLTEEEKQEAMEEGVKYFRLSRKIENLIEKLKDKHFKIPGEASNQLDKAIKILKNDILKTVKNVESDYDRGNINWKQASYKLNKIKIKVKEVKNFLKKEKIFNPIEWEKYVYVLTSLMWIPAAIAGFKDLSSALAAKSSS